MVPVPHWMDMQVFKVWILYTNQIAPDKNIEQRAILPNISPFMKYNGT
jgi:hypothetical protein